ncbi:MAG: cation:proton antiporter [Nitrososphaerota archaeon]|nr:cation:proton antiporter [Nitrososphaerota archaeon]MDG6956640.1 cation:proton antiporter [Nitrososphaerota archaeon]MDG6960636.1 cation:proton antiporter [Nitrososphaerota archaeon]MDG6965598.1 cation:proton antiporter [Nitrososphaerota archaeon]MDG6987481.1 cation:proton antiporter [Nitrososphaerota archaeon]
MVDTTSILTFVAAIIVVGFLGELFFKKTGVPMFIFLILMGIIIGPVLNFFPRTSLLPSLGVFAVLTLLMVLFYGGIDTSLDSVRKGGGRAFLQVLVYVLGSTAAIAFIINALLGWGLVSSFIFASMVGGETTAAVVIPLSRSLKLPEATVAFLTLESAMNSILLIVLFFAFVGIYQTGIANPVATLTKVSGNFSVGIVLGGILSIVWVFVLNRVQQRKYTYVLTLGLVFITYVISDSLGGSGELSVLIFGIVLGNYALIGRLTNWHFSMDVLQQRLGVFQEEISFLMETLFFVFLGLTFEINPSSVIDFLAVGAVIVGVLMLFRVLATAASTVGSDLARNRRDIITMCAQGLVPATLAIIAVDDGLPHANSFLNVVTYVIILTNIIAAAGAIWRIRSQRSSFKEFMEGLDVAYKSK